MWSRPDLLAHLPAIFQIVLIGGQDALLIPPYLVLAKSNEA